MAAPREAKEISDGELLEAIKEERSIYDSTSKGYRDKRGKAYAWKRIGEAVRCSDVESLQKRWRTVRKKASERKRALSQSGAGVEEDAGNNDEDLYAWIFPFIKNRSTVTNEP